MTREQWLWRQASPMNKRPALHVIREREPAPCEIVPLRAVRETSWRDLMRRLARNLARTS